MTSPGLVIAVPARPDDAAAMLRTCLAAAEADGSVCVFLEPIALYHARDLCSPGDGGWLAPYPPPGEWAAGHVPAGRARAYPVPGGAAGAGGGAGAGGAVPHRAGGGGGGDLSIVTFGNGVRLSLRAAARLARAGIGCRVLDLRWLAPLPAADILREALYGAPGTGKTHTVSYLIGQMPQATVVVLTGDALQLISQACSVARVLQPS